MKQGAEKYHKMLMLLHLRLHVFCKFYKVNYKGVMRVWLFRFNVSFEIIYKGYKLSARWKAMLSFEEKIC